MPATVSDRSRSQLPAGRALSSAAVRPVPWTWLRTVLVAAVSSLLAQPASAQADRRVRAPELAELSLEQLREVVVTTVSRADERLDRVAASVYVIGADDIRRSGATTLPEALRLAPTLTVARADANQYAISARGFDNVLANKLLVLIDGRTVYTPLFSGVFWEAQDVMLEDVERIEVVTGPSTALWGSNAVNALVHVITKAAAATQGWAATAHAGNEERGGAARYGGAAAGPGRGSGSPAWRAYAKTYDRSTSRRADGSTVGDAASGEQVGWRADWSGGPHAVMLQGDVYKGRIGAASPGLPRRFSGANLVTRWQHERAEHQTSMQLSLDHTERDQPGNFSDRLDTVDLVAQHGLEPLAGHRLVVGGGVRRALDRASGNPGLAFMPASRALQWRRLFAQDQIQATPTLVLTLAASLESNPYTGRELLPSLRLAWTGLPGGMLWGSLSRAARAPSRVDREFFTPAQPPYVLAGGPNFRSERSDVLEIGWRAQPTPTLSYALTLHHTQHKYLRSLAPTAAGLQFENGIRGHGTGLESWARWQPALNWRLDGGFVLQEQSLRVAGGARDLGGLPLLGNAPRRQGSLRSSVDIAPGWRWDADLRHGGSRSGIPAYSAFDTRLSWALKPGAELSLGLQNLFDPSHAEWGTTANRVELERSMFLRLRLWQ